MDRSIVLTAEMLALESNANPATLVETGYAKLKTLFDDAGSFVSNTMNDLKGYFQGTSGAIFNQNFVKDSVDGLNYMSVSAMEVPAPMGLSVPFNVYVGVLEDHVGLASSLIKEVLDPTIDYLAMMISHPELLTSMRGVESKTRFRDLDKPKEKIGSCLEGKAQLSKVPFKKAYQRFADYEHMAVKLNRINDIMLNVDKQEITDRATRAVELLDKLHARLEASSDTKLSGTVAGHLGKLALNLAQEIEFFGILFHKVQEASETYKLTIDQVDRFSKS